MMYLVKSTSTLPFYVDINITNMLYKLMFFECSVISVFFTSNLCDVTCCVHGKWALLFPTSKRSNKHPSCNLDQTMIFFESSDISDLLLYSMQELWLPYVSQNSDF